MANKLPWFPMYASDFINDPRVIALSNEQRGIYFWLLCRQWMNGSLPYDVHHVYPLFPIGAESAAIAYVLTEFFPADPDTNERRNPRLTEIQMEQEASVEARKRRTEAARKAKGSGQSLLQPLLQREKENQSQNQKEDVDEDVLRAADFYLRDPNTRTPRIGTLRGLLQGITGSPVSKAALVRGLEDMTVAGAKFTALSVRGFARKAQELLEGEAGRRAAESSVLRQPDANQSPSEDDL